MIRLECATVKVLDGVFPYADAAHKRISPEPFKTYDLLLLCFKWHRRWSTECTYSHGPRAHFSRKLPVKGNHATGPVPVEKAAQDSPKPAVQNGDTVVLPAEAAAAMEEEHEILHASIRAASIGQLVVATVALIGLIYLAKVVLVTVLTSLLIAFMSEPIVDGLGRLKVPRAVGALIPFFS